MLFSKKFFRLRRKEGKARKTGYYWVRWTYNTDINDGWRLGFYIDTLNTWSLMGDSRTFKDNDFISVNEKRVEFLFYPKLLSGLCIVIIGWNAAYILYIVIEFLYKLKR